MSSARALDRWRSAPGARTILIVAAIGLVAVLHTHLLPAISFALSNLWQIAPIVIAGVVVTGALTAAGSVGLLVETFGAREGAAILLVSLVGAVLPVCGITVLPLVAGLLGAGMALAPVMAFLLSSAVTDPTMFAITAVTLGTPFAVGKTVAAFGIGVLGGAATWGATRAGLLRDPMRRSRLVDALAPQTSCSDSTDVRWRFWTEPARRAAFVASCWHMTKLVVVFLGLAFVAEHFLRLYLPQDALVRLVGRDSPLAIPIAALVAAPLYLDGYAALPLVRGLVDLGMAAGAAMAFLIAGGIISAWTALPVLALVRLPVFATYAILAVAGAMMAGTAYAIVIG